MRVIDGKGGQSIDSAQRGEPRTDAHAHDPLARLAWVRDHVLPAGGRVLVCASGGPDSMALLGAAALAFDARASVAWVDHGWRAGTPDRQIVSAACAARGLAFAPLAIRRSAPTETCARRARLARLAEHARRCGAGALLLAHHAHDDDETLLLHLRRGHLEDRARAGIPHLRRTEPGGPWLVRPFLMGPALAPATLDAWRRAHGLDAFHDPTNDDLSIPRNALRARLRAGAFDRAALAALRRRARARLARRVGDAVALLAGAEPVGAGLGLVREALATLEVRHGDGGLAELVRLLGLALHPARRLDPRATVIARLRERLATGAGRLWIPGRPRGVWLAATRTQVLLPEAGTATRSPADAALEALLATPLYVGGC